MSAMTRSTKLDDAALLTTLRKQKQVIGRGQALACGMTEGALRHRTAPGGRWRRLLPGVYLAATGLPTVVQLEVAALLYAGSGILITGAAALRHQGLRAPRTERITVLIPAGRAVRSVSFVQVWRTTRMPPVFLEDGPVRVALPPRAAADAARSLTGLRDVRAVIADAVQKNQCPAFLLAEELDSGSGPRSPPAAGGHRWPCAPGPVQEARGACVARGAGTGSPGLGGGTFRAGARRARASPARRARSGPSPRSRAWARPA